MTITALDAAALAARGANLLDEEYPGWADRIDLDRLNLSLADRCVLGQLYAGVDDYRYGYYAALDRFWPEGRAYAKARAVTYGFTVAEPEGEWTDEETSVISAKFDLLEAEWRTLIAARRTPSYEG